MTIMTSTMYGYRYRRCVVDEIHDRSRVLSTAIFKVISLIQMVFFSFGLQRKRLQ